MALTTLLLPGLDGTGLLFDRVVAALPPDLSPRVVAYPAEPLGYAALTDRVLAELPEGPFALVAESFSGPIALRVAARRPAGLAAVVLVATFVRPPSRVPAALASLLCRLPPPRAALRFFLLGAGAPPGLDEELARAIASVPPRVLAARVAEVLRVDARADLRACPAPLLVVTAAHDRLVPSAAAAIRTDRPDARCVDVAGPHLLLQARASAVAPIVAEFLRGST